MAQQQRVGGAHGALGYCPVTPDPALVARARFIVGYVGTIGPQDGLDVMRALRHLVFDLGRREVLAVVVGDGDALADVHALAAELELEPFVHFTGRLPEDAARQVLSAAHVCVQPDPSSPLNDHSTMNKLMEYMALGKPTVAFDLPETRFSAQEAAHYVAPNDEMAFARAVAALLDAPQERERMGRVGMQRVSESLAWEHSVPPLLAAYAALAKSLHATAWVTAWPGSRRCQSSCLATTTGTILPDLRWGACSPRRASTSTCWSSTTRPPTGAPMCADALAAHDAGCPRHQARTQPGSHRDVQRGSGRDRG